MTITNFMINEINACISWEYNTKNILINESNIQGAQYYPDEKLILVLKEDNDNNTILVGFNETGSIRFKVQSTDTKGISYIAKHPNIKIAVVGWEKEERGWLDYFYSINPTNGEMSKYGRAY